MSNVKPIYDNLMGVLKDIDEKLDSLEDPATSGKRAIANQLVEQFQETWQPTAAAIIAQVNNVGEENPDAVVGIYRGLKSALEKEFDKKIQEILDEKVKNIPKSEPLISQEQALELSKQRSEIYQQIKMAVNLAATAEGVELEMPKPRRGSKGKRGKRALTLMVWSIDGEEVNPQPETLKEFSESLGFESSKAFYDFLKEKGVNTTKPENNELRVSLPDGRELYGEIPEDEADKVDEDDSSSDED